MLPYGVKAVTIQIMRVEKTSCLVKQTQENDNTEYKIPGLFHSGGFQTPNRAAILDFPDVN